MCTRYWVDASPELRPIVEEMNRSVLTARFKERTGRVFSPGEVRPSDLAAAVARNRKGQRAVFPMRWGFSGKSLLLNARAETAAVKPTFRECFERRRCLLPASWYYEWEHFASPDGKKRITGAKYAIQPEGATVTWLAGLYRFEEHRGIQVPVFAALTRQPSDSVKILHDRMPLILPQDSIAEWIRPDGDPAEIAGKALRNMVMEKVG